MLSPVLPRLLLIMATILLAGCGERHPPTGPITSLPRDLTPAERTIIRDANAFGLELFRRVYAAEKAPNVFISPLSASMALGMTLNGAAGETWVGMRKALAFEGLEQPEINGAYQSLHRLLIDLDPRVEVSIGNSLWADEEFPVLPSFYDAATTYFDAEARSLDFRDPATVGIINEWVEEATKGKIDKAIDEISFADFMFLINAIYFSGDWTSRFDKERTRTASFRRADGSTVDVAMMNQKATIPFAWGTRWAAGELAYGGGAYAMLVVVPQHGQALADIVAELDADGWAALLESLKETEVDISLPRFSIEYDAYLNEPLIGMGMDSAFSADADFSKLSPVGVCIQYVRQKSMVEVDEKGTTAAAVTVVSVGLTSMGPTLSADRPFLVAIRERMSGTLLFVGAIGDPTATDAPLVEKPRPPC